MEQFIKQAEANSVKLKAIKNLLQRSDDIECSQASEVLDIKAELRGILTIDGYAEYHWQGSDTHLTFDEFEKSRLKFLA